MKPLSEEWIAKAEGDFKVALNEFVVADPVYDAVCFHAQQCVEKYLKAWLTEQIIEFPRTHDLEDLTKRATPSLPQLSAHTDDLIFLTSAAVESRYPGLSAELEDMNQAIRTMRTIRTVIRSALGLPVDPSS